MDYAKVIKLPQLFRNLQRLSEIAGVLARHGFGDLLNRLRIPSYLASGIRLIDPNYRSDQSPHIPLSVRLRLAFEELGPVFMKFGQIIATRPDVFPRDVIVELRKLQDKAPPFPFRDVEAVIIKELGANIAELYKEFNKVPIAAASMAQVHKAVLKDNRAVVVKVQRPDIERVIETDLDILRGFATLLEENIPESLAFSPSKLVEEFARSIQIECNFKREAINTDKFAKQFAEDESILIPEVFHELSSSKVLTEEFIDGVRGDDTEGLLNNNVNGKVVVQTLRNMLLKSIFEYRFFHADPHPGNILFTADNKVALIDCGAMGRIDKQRLHQVLIFLVALLARDLDKMLRVLRENQLAPRALDEVPLKNQVSEILDAYLDAPVGKLDVSRLLADIFEVLCRYGIQAPPDLMLIARSLTTLQYIGALLDPEFEPINSLRPYLAKRYASHLTDTKLYAEYAAEVADSYQRLLTDLPKELRAILRNIANDELTVNYSMKNLAEVKEHQNAMLNRALLALIGIMLTTLGTLLAVFHPGGLNTTIAYFVIFLGILVLFATWLAIRKTGGPS